MRPRHIECGSVFNGAVTFSCIYAGRNARRIFCIVSHIYSADTPSQLVGRRYVRAGFPSISRLKSYESRRGGIFVLIPRPGAPAPAEESSCPFRTTPSPAARSREAPPGAPRQSRSPSRRPPSLRPRPPRPASTACSSLRRTMAATPDMRAATPPCRPLRPLRPPISRIRRRPPRPTCRAPDPSPPSRTARADRTARTARRAVSGGPCPRRRRGREPAMSPGRRRRSRPAQSSPRP